MTQLPFLRFLAEAGGSWVIVLLIACSVFSIAIIIDRVLVVYRQARYQNNVLPDLLDRMTATNFLELIRQLKTDSVAYRVADDVVRHAGIETGNLHERLDTRLALEKRFLERRVLWLGTLGNNAPFIGLLGTVLGVVHAFHSLAAAGNQGPEVVMDGLAEALIATAIGILVALPCVVAYNLINKRIKDVLLDADRLGKQLIGFLRRNNT